MIAPRRVTLFCGHYGSGKTNLAVNYALWLARQGHPTRIADLDIVNPYFRTKDSKEQLEQAGVELISPAFANTNLDLPALPQQAYAAVQDRTKHAVLDVGGDDRGALALGRYVPGLREEQNYEMLFVVNFYRPLTTTPQEALEVLREVESAAGLACTALVNNSNLGNDTSPQTLLSTVEKAQELSRLSGLPVKMTGVRQDLLAPLQGQIPNLFGLQLQDKYFDIKET